MDSDGRQVGRPSRRSEIVDTAATLFAERGFGGVTIDEIAAALDIAGPALYWHFSSKEAILYEALSSVPETLLALAVRTVAAGGDPLGILHRLIDQHVDLALARPAYFRVWLRETGQLSVSARQEVERGRQLYVEVYVQVLSSLVPQGPLPEVRAGVQAVLRALDATSTIVRQSDGQPGRRAVEILRRAARAALVDSWRGLLDGDPPPPAGPGGRRPKARGARLTQRAVPAYVRDR